MKITEAYKTPEIPEPERPEYQNADDFAKKAEFCGITKDVAFMPVPSNIDVRTKK